VVASKSGLVHSCGVETWRRVSWHTRHADSAHETLTLNLRTASGEAGCASLEQQVNNPHGATSATASTGGESHRVRDEHNLCGGVRMLERETRVCLELPRLIVELRATQTRSAVRRCWGNAKAREGAEGEGDRTVRICTLLL
jgi:hypothetical protein